MMNKYEQFIYGAICSLCMVSFASISLRAEMPRQTPAWVGVKKTEEQKEADVKFVQKITKLFGGDRNLAARESIKRGWIYIRKGDVEMALRRFNQGWLLNPKRGDVYWGFAIATGMRGDKLVEVEKWFERAEEIIGPISPLYSDWGRILEQRNRPNSAIAKFKKAIELDPKNPEPHIGMMRASKRLGDVKTLNKHLRIYRTLKE